MHQNEDGTFASMGMASGINDRAGTSDRVKAGQNVGWSDIDGDGDLDVLIGGRDNGGVGRANFLFENTIGQKNGWVGVRLRGDGTTINRDAIGARVTLTVAGKTLVREVRSSRGTYSSAASRALLFGLGAQGCENGLAQVAIDVRWPNGETKHLEAGSFGLNRYLTIDYASGLLKNCSPRSFHERELCHSISTSIFNTTSSVSASPAIVRARSRATPRPLPQVPQGRAPPRRADGALRRRAAHPALRPPTADRRGATG